MRQMKGTKFIKAEEMKNEPYSGYVERIRNSENAELAGFIEMEGMKEDSLKYIAENGLKAKLEMYCLGMLERHAESKWFELLNSYATNETALEEIEKAFEEDIEPEYVMEYLPECSDEFEMSKKRSKYEEWKKLREEQHLQPNEENEDEEVVKDDDNTVGTQKEETKQKETETQSVVCAEVIEDEYAGKVQDMLGMSIGECVEEVIKDDSLENLMSYLSNAIVVSNKKDVHIEKLKRIIAAQNHYIKQNEEQIRELVEENEELRNRLLHISHEKKYDAQKFLELQKKLSEVEKIKNEIGMYPGLEIEEKC